MAVRATGQCLAFNRAELLEGRNAFSGQDGLDQLVSQQERANLVVMLYSYRAIVVIRVHGHREVRRQRPGRRGPDQQIDGLVADFG